MKLKPIILAGYSALAGVEGLTVLGELHVGAPEQIIVRDLIFCALGVLGLAISITHYSHQRMNSQLHSNVLNKPLLGGEKHRTSDGDKINTGKPPKNNLN